MKLPGAGLLLLMTFSYSLPSFSQANTYIRNGNATQDNCNCYTLTQSTNNQSGSVWNAAKINLHNSFDFIFNVNLGCKDGDGADGIVFILQPISTSIGTAGGGMGFSGVTPSIGIALDTWQNTDLNDPLADHISIQANGNLNHNADLAGPVNASSSNINIEDCKWHTFRITWDAGTHWLRSYFDGELRVEAQRDLITTIFNNDPMVYWGFSAATGGANNLQQFCTALNPEFTTNLTNNATCIGESVQFNNTSQSFAPIANFYWDFGDGSHSSDINPAPHQYSMPGLYNIKLAVTGFDGCNSDTSRKTIAIGDIPIADFEIFDTCAGKAPRIIDHSKTQVGTISKWEWTVNGSAFSVASAPDFSALTAGSYDVQLTVTSNYGCRSSVIQKRFVIKATPAIKATALNGCIDLPIQLNGTQLDNATTIVKWEWMGETVRANSQHTAHTYHLPGSYSEQLIATASNGCVSDGAFAKLIIYKATANAGNDTVFIKDTPFQLHGTGGLHYTWSPAFGLSDPGSPNPTGILKDDMDYRLTVTTAEGCIDEDMIHIEIFKGSNVFVPSGFTPNGDGLNEELKPYYVGIKKLNYFTVYNRWGQLLFTTKNTTAGWNGMVKGIPQASGVYVWIVRATDYVGKLYELKGTTTLIR